MTIQAKIADRPGRGSGRRNRAQPCRRPEGELIIAGERVADLAAKPSFEGVTARLWTAATDVPISEAEVRAALGEARVRAFARLTGLSAQRGSFIVDGFRAAIARLRAENGLTA